MLLARVRYIVNDTSCSVRHELYPGVDSSTDRAGGKLGSAVSADHVTTGAAEHWDCPDRSQAYWTLYQGLQMFQKIIGEMALIHFCSFMIFFCSKLVNLNIFTIVGIELSHFLKQKCSFYFSFFACF